MSENPVTLDEAIAIKAQAALPKVWNYHLFADPQAAVVYVNTPPAQGAGEAIFSVRENGLTDTFFFFSEVLTMTESAGAQPKTWHWEGPLANPTTAINVANRDPAQGAGEAVFSVLENASTATFLFY